MHNCGIQNSQFAEILNVPETCPQKVLNFSHVWIEEKYKSCEVKRWRWTEGREKEKQDEEKEENILEWKSNWSQAGPFSYKNMK